jgi:competence protein ComEC
MAIIFLSSYLLKREPDIYNSLALAALFILWVNPRQIFDVGFQLSFMSVISIVCLYPKLVKLLRLEFLKIRPLRFLLDGLLVSFSAWLGTAGFIAYYFKIFSPITVLANIFIVPLAALITLCGFSIVIIGPFFFSLAKFFAYSNEFLVIALLKINAFLIHLPYAYLFLS